MANEIQNLEAQKEKIQKALSSSRTAYARNTDPTSGDISMSQSLASLNSKIQSLKSDQLGKRWYGNDDTEVKEQPKGVFLGALEALQRPMSGIIGAGQYALGKGSKSSLTGNINEAMKTGLTAGDVLNQYGVKRGVQIPLGFALDVMLDPVNWLTAGTAALIPRVGAGFVKGGLKTGVKGALEAGKTGLTSGLEKKAATTMSLIPFAKRSATFRDLAEKTGKKAIQGAEKYDELVGKTVYDKLGKGIFGQPAGAISGMMEEAVKKLPNGEKVVDFFKYSPKKQAEIADLKDKVINLARDKGVLLSRTEEGSNFQKIDEFLSPDAKITIPDKVGENMEIAIRDADGALKKDYIGQNKVYDSFENAQALLEAAGEDYNIKHLTEAYKKSQIGTTGVQWYDNVINRLKNTTVDDLMNRRLGESVIKDVKKDSKSLIEAVKSYEGVKDMKPINRLINANNTLTTLFKAAKVPMNLSSHVVANIGNFFMGAMMGLPVYKPKYINEIATARKFVSGKLGPKGMQDMLGDVKMFLEMADNNPTKFKQITGINAEEVIGKIIKDRSIAQSMSIKEKGDQLLETIKGIFEGNIDTLSKDSSWLEKAVKETADIVDETHIGGKIMREQGTKFKTQSEAVGDLLKEAPLKRSEEYGSWTAGELTQSDVLNKLKKTISKELEKTTDPVRKSMLKAADLLVNKMPNWYEHIDQSFKIGTTNYLMKFGLTEQELVTISRMVDITKDDLLEPIIENGQKMYRLKALKAGEVAVDAYMNYAAMPDFVRVMRAVPFAGAPFFSFPYAMAAKTATTAVHNPAVFNKVGFMLDEMNAGRTPEEKVALESKYNQYLNSPTVAKVFGMWNTDVKNFVPYYTMNMFNPSDRGYDDSPQGSVLKQLDKVPMFQHPVGQVIKDYFIQPWVLSGTGQSPQGQFGQPLYPSFDEKGNPIKAGLGTKSFYAGRTLAESLVPGSLSFLGALNAPLGLSPEAVDYIPSYGARSLANATQGRSSIGKQTKEDAVRKTFRSLLGRTGFPAYNLDPTKTKINK